MLLLQVTHVWLLVWFLHFYPAQEEPSVPRNIGCTKWHVHNNPLKLCNENLFSETPAVWFLMRLSEVLTQTDGLFLASHFANILLNVTLVKVYCTSNIFKLFFLLRNRSLQLPVTKLLLLMPWKLITMAIVRALLKLAHTANWYLTW